jgi:hypothetical protein
MVLSTFNVSASVCRVQMDGDTGKISDSEVEYAAYFTDIERLEYFKQYEGKIIRSIGLRPSCLICLEAVHAIRWSIGVFEQHPM